VRSTPYGPLTITTLFLDAGGVLCHPSWTRVSLALASHGVTVSAETLAAAEPHAKKEMDEATVISATTDAARGWLYFNKVLEHAGVPLSPATDQALDELRVYHRAENLWEHVPLDVIPAVTELRRLGLRLVVVSNANGRLRHLFDRLELTAAFDLVLDSHEWGVEKPDPRLFHIALEQSGGRANSTAHVGDFFHIDVAGARAAGLREGILLDTADLYPQADCRRVRTLGELAVAVRNGRG
jgi:HAD superfamily hydrolase (TIGR01549 family)